MSKILSFIPGHLYSQLFVTLPTPTKDFTGETIIVTGCNTGLGFEAVRHLSRCNASLIIMAVRNLSKGHAARQKILESTGQKSETIEVWELDLQSIDSVKAFARKANQLKRLDGVLENAGMTTKEFKVIEGFETTILVNVVSTALLAVLLIPKLKESGVNFNVQPRLSIVSSDTHFLTNFQEGDSENVFEALNVEKSGMWSFERFGALFIWGFQEQFPKIQKVIRRFVG